jgi:hypothetical protein
MRKAGEMANNKPREDRAKSNIHAFLQHRIKELRRDYLARGGRRFAAVDLGQLNEDWINATRNWLARKDRTTERMMDDLTAELRLRGLEPPYDAVKQELATRFAGIKEAEQTKIGRAIARQIGVFVRAKSRSID